MNILSFLLEVVFVGVYSASLYIVIESLFPFRSPLPIVLFLVGFLKHYLGYKLYIQDYYCNHSASCKKNASYASDKYLLEVSVAEGAWFCALGILTMKKINSVETNMYIMFFIGAVTHILAEFSGIHAEFCRINCRTI